MDSAVVHTIKDIEIDTGSPRRRKNTSKACSSCRKLKIRCREPVRDNCISSCLHCRKLGHACSWPAEDARKQNRPRPKPRWASPPATSYQYDTKSVAEHEASDLPEERANAEDSDLANQAHQHIDDDCNLTQASDEVRTTHSVLQYHRYLGSTAIAPGYKKISLKIANENLDLNEQGDKSHDPLQHVNVSVIDPRTNLPRSELIPPLLDAFFEYYGSNSCFLNRAQLESLIRENEISVFLLCSIAALSSRFCSPDVFAPYLPQLPEGQERECWQNSLPFLSQAKRLLMPLLSIPSCDLVAGLLFLALAEFGDNNEAGMWMFTGMSVRVAQELGLQRQRPSTYTSIGRSPTNDASEAASRTLQAPTSSASERFEMSSQIILFWCVFVQDTSLANGTGRVPSIKINEVSIPLPTDDDVAFVKAGPYGLTYSTEAHLFPCMVRMMLEYARSIEFLNTEYQPGKRPQGGGQALNAINTIRARILTAYDAVPHELGCGAAQYRNASSSGQAIPYLVMHLNFHLQIAYLVQAGRAVEHRSQRSDYYDESQPPDCVDPQVTTPQGHRAYEDQLYRTAMKSIVDLLTIARFVDSRPLLSTFFLNQAFFHAACAYAGDMFCLQHHTSYKLSLWDGDSAFPLPSYSSTSVVFDLDELRASTKDQASLSSAELYLGLLAKTNYQFLRQAIKEMAKYYAGAGWVDAVLNQRESGIRDVDLSIVSESISTYIRLHDLQASRHTSAQASKSRQTLQNSVQYSGDLMFSQDILSNIPPNFDSQAFFNDYIFADPSMEPG